MAPHQPSSRFFFSFFSFFFCFLEDLRDLEANGVMLYPEGLSDIFSGNEYRHAFRDVRIQEIDVLVYLANGV